MAEKETVILDASTVVKWFSDEELTQQALEIRQNYADQELEIVVPNLLLTEIANALRYNPKFNEDDVKNAVQSLYDMDFHILAPSPDTIKKATEISFDLETTIYDSIYLALANQLDCKCITTDQELVNKYDKATNLAEYK